MRSRYSAFCQGNADYLIATHHPDYRAGSDRTSLLKTIRTTEWTNLLIVRTQKGQKKEKTGTVEFVAAYRSKSLLATTQSTLEQLHEKSRFVKEKGRWLYTEGDMLPAYVPKPSALCWCGSGQTFKRCHA